MKIGYFVAGDEMQYPLSFDQAPPPGQYQARLTLLGEDCVYQALFTEDFFIEPDEFHFAEAEALRWDQAEQDPSAEPGTQPQSVLNQVGLLLIGTALIILVLALLLILINSMRSRDQVSTSAPGFQADNISTGRVTVLRMQAQKGGEQTS